jgi:hypothetical protein
MAQKKWNIWGTFSKYFYWFGQASQQSGSISVANPAFNTGIVWLKID